MHGQPRRVGRRRRGALRRDFAVGLLHGLRPAAHVVAQLIGGKVIRIQPRAGLEADDVKTGTGERQYGDTAGGAESDDHHLPLPQFGRHACHTGPQRHGVT